MSKRNLLNRVKNFLCMILAVAMVFTSMPETAFAASVDMGSDFVASEDVAVEDADITVDDTDAVVEADDAVLETEDATEELEADADELDVLDADTIETEEEDILLDSEKIKYTIVSALDEYDTTAIYDSYDAFSYRNWDGEVVLAGWIGDKLSITYIDGNGHEQVKLDSLANDKFYQELDGIKLVWEQKNADGKYVVMPTSKAPVEVGEYRLTITMESDVAELEPFVQEFKVVPDTIYITPNVQSVTPGTAAKDVTLGDATYYGYESGAAFEYKADGTGDITMAIKVVDAASQKELAATDKLVVGKSYTMTITPAFADTVSKDVQKNFTFAEVPAVAVEASDLIPTYVEVTTSSPVTYTYGDKVAAPTLSTKVTYDAGDDVRETITATADEMSYGWFVYEQDCVYNYNINATYIYYNNVKWIALGEGEEPTNAGTYIYRAMYTPAGENAGIYAPSYGAVRVVIEPKKFAIKPVLENQVVTGSTVAEVLSTVSPVFLYKGAQVNDIPADVLGVDNGAYNSTNAYEPVFEIQKRSEKKYVVVSTNQVVNLLDGDNLATIVKDSKYDYFWETLGLYDRLDKEQSYRIRFSGEKAVFLYHNEYHFFYESKTNVNNNLPSKNYAFATDEATRSADAIEVTFSAVAGTEIKVDGLYGKADDGKTATGDSAENPVEIEYTGSPIFNDELFANRGLYKIAEVFSGSTKIAEKLDSSIFYQWQYRYFTGRYEDGQKVYAYSNEKTGSNIVPTNVGEYRLHITYDDPAGKYVSAETDVYFKIIPKPVVIVPVVSGDSVSFNAYAGRNVESFLYELGTVSFNVCEAIQDKDGNIVAGESLGWTQWDQYDDFYDTLYSDISYTDEYAYAVEYFDNNSKSWEEMSLGSLFEMGGQYRLSPRCFNSSINYAYDSFKEDYVQNYSDTFIVKTEENGAIVRTEKCLKDTYTIAINAKKIGDTLYTVTADPSKLTTNQMVYSGEAFDISGDVANGLLVLSTRDKSVSDDVIAAVTKDELKYFWNKDGEAYEEAIDAGDYYLCASLAPTEEHKAIDPQFVTDADGNYVMIRILKKDLFVTPVLNKDTAFAEGAYLAGLTPYDVVDYSATIFDGVVPRDEALFQFNDYFCDNDYANEQGYLAYNGPHLWNDEDFSTTGSRFNAQLVGDIYTVVTEGNVLSGAKTYKLVLNNTVSFDAEVLNNYNISQSETEVTFTTVRNVSSIYSYGMGNIESVIFTDSADVAKLTHTVNVIDSIKFAHGVQYATGTGEVDLAGNYVYFEIRKPAEYGNVPVSTAYTEAIEAAGGIIVSGGYGNNYIGFVLKATDETGKPAKTSFQITWEPGYAETYTFDFAHAVLEADLSKAVAPKSLKFNVAAKKMIVGQEQELDVAITKKQMDDVICLKYESSDPSVVYVNKDGRATAIKVGSATITATPCQIINGEQVVIEKAKVASVKISVANVKAPNVNKVDVYGSHIKVTYTPVKDGWSRTEIYVVPGKVKDADVEAMIAKVQNGNWAAEGFAVDPIFLNDNNWDQKTRTIRIDGLSPVTEYTVYVRNASRARTVAGTSYIVANEYKNGALGKVKSFKTTKIQLLDLDVRFGSNVSWNEVTERYEVELLDGKSQLTVEGIYEAYPTDNRADNAYYDNFNYALPLTKEQANTFMQPKLKFFADTELDILVNPSQDDISGYINAGWKQYYKWNDASGNARYVFGPKTGAVTVTGKGVLSLKKLSTVQVVVVDTVSGLYQYVNATPVDNFGGYGARGAFIVTDITSATPKKTNMNVGQVNSVYSLFTYKNGSKNVAAADPRFYEICGKGVESIITAIDGEGFEGVDSQELHALLAGKTATVKVHDVKLGDLEAVVTVKKIDPVKALKVSEITDCKSVVTFTYPTATASEMVFRVDLKNDRKEVIDSKLINAGSVVDWNAKRKVATFKTTLIGLTQQSKYTVEVTAIRYTNETYASSKAVKKAFKSTKLPARCTDVPEILADPNAVDVGDTITIPSLGNGVVNAYPTGGRAIYAGNTYTLVANVSNPRAREMATDTLIWSIDNTKIAKLKVNTGSYSATLTALRAGTAVITIKSRITGKVISRRSVNVSPVGAAYNKNRYYGQNEEGKGTTGQFYNGQNNGTFYKGCDAFVPGSSVAVTNDKLTNYYVFSAPAAGYYEFSAVADDAKGSIRLNLANDYGNTYGSYDSITLASGVSLRNVRPEEQTANGNGLFKYVRFFGKDDTVYFAVNRSNAADKFTINVKEFEPDAVLSDKETTVKFVDGFEEMFYKYTATEAGTYTIKTVSVNGTANVQVALDVRSGKVDGASKNILASAGPDAYGETAKTVALDAGETVYVKANVSGEQNPTVVGLVVEKMAEVKVGTSEAIAVSANSPATVAFIPETSGVYTFTSVSVDAAVYAGIKGQLTNYYPNYDSLHTTTGNDNGAYDGFRFAQNLTAGTTYYLTVTSEGTEQCKFQVAIEKAKEVALDTPVVIESVKGVQKNYVTFTAPENGYYTFYSEDVEKDTVSSNGLTMYYSDSFNNADYYNVANSTGGINQFGHTVEMGKGKTLYLRINNLDLTKANKYVVNVKAAKALTLGSEETVKLPATDGVIRTEVYTFTANQAGFYIFQGADIKDKAPIDSKITIRKDTELADSDWNFDDLPVAYANDDNSGAEQQFKSVVYLSEGQRVVVDVTGKRVTPDADPAKNTVEFTFSVTRASSIATGSENAIKLANGEKNGIVTFTPAADGYYTIYTDTNNATKNIIDINYISYYNASGRVGNEADVVNSGAVSTNYAYTGYLYADCEYVIRVSNDDTDASLPQTDLVVGVKTTDALTVDADQTVKFAKFETEKNYQFTAEEDGYYVIKTSYGKEDTNATINVSVSGGVTDSHTDNVNRIYSAIKYLTKGQTIVVTARRTNAEAEKGLGSYTITLTRPVDVTKASNEVTLSQNAVEYYSFTAPEYGAYQILATDKLADPNKSSVGFYSYTTFNEYNEYVYVDNSINTMNTGAGVNSYVVLDAGYTYTFVVRGNAVAANKPMNSKVDVSVTKASSEVLPAEGELELTKGVSTNGIKWLTYTAPADGVYSLYSLSADGVAPETYNPVKGMSVGYAVYGIDSDPVEYYAYDTASPYAPAKKEKVYADGQFTLTAGQSLLIGVYAGPSIAFNVGIEHFNTKVVKVDAYDTASLSNNAVDGGVRYQWFEFDIEKTDMYVLKASQEFKPVADRKTGAYNDNFEYNVCHADGSWDRNSSSYATDNGYDMFYDFGALTAGDKVFVKLMVNDYLVTDKAIDFRVSVLSPVDASTAANISLSSNEIRYVRVTQPETDVYATTFASASTNKISATLSNYVYYTYVKVNGDVVMNYFYANEAGTIAPNSERTVAPKTIYNDCVYRLKNNDGYVNADDASVAITVNTKRPTAVLKSTAINKTQVGDYYEFTIPADGTYRVTVTREGSDVISEEYVQLYRLVANAKFGRTLATGNYAYTENGVSGNAIVNAGNMYEGDSLIVYVRSTDSSDAVKNVTLKLEKAVQEYNNYGTLVNVKNEQKLPLQVINAVSDNSISFNVVPFVPTYSGTQDVKMTYAPNTKDATGSASVYVFAQDPTGKTWTEVQTDAIASATSIEIGYYDEANNIVGGNVRSLSQNLMAGRTYYLVVPNFDTAKNANIEVTITNYKYE